LLLLPLFKLLLLLLLLLMMMMMMIARAIFAKKMILWTDGKEDDYDN
jgi:hypothetical protein